MKKIKIFEVPIFKGLISLHTGTPDEFIAILKKKNIEIEISETQSGKTVWDTFNGLEFFVWIKNKNDLPTIAHEMLHVANAILISRGIRVDPDNDEIQAYLVEYLISKVI